MCGVGCLYWCGDACVNMLTVGQHVTLYSLLTVVVMLHFRISESLAKLIQKDILINVVLHNVNHRNKILLIDKQLRTICNNCVIFASCHSFFNAGMCTMSYVTEIVYTCMSSFEVLTCCNTELSRWKIRSSILLGQVDYMYTQGMYRLSTGLRISWYVTFVE